MAVKGSATVTLTQYRDIQSVTRYYKLRPAGSSAPLKPETKPPSSDWTDSEPACDISKELYFCDLTIFSNGEWEYSKVSKSTSYEAAKEAYHKAQSAKDSVDNLEIGGRNYFSNKTSMAFNEANEFTLANYQNTGSFTQFRNLTVPMRYFVGKKCVLSFDCISPNGSTPISVYNNNGGPRYLMNTSGIISPINNEWIHQELMITVTDRGDSSSYDEAQSNKIEIYCSAQMGCKVRNVKLEIGNKATDWTPAPEDVDAGIANAQETADSIANNIYVTDSTLLDGSKISDGSLSINQMDDTVAGTYSDPTTKKGTMEWNDDALHIKSTDANAQNTYETVIGGDGIKFNWNGVETASINQDELRINKTVVINAMEVGNWSWAIHPTTGNLMVKWNGGE